MADKGRIKHSIDGLQRIKTWQLLVLFVLVAFIAATFLRLNNIGMVQRREAVLSADEVGKEQPIIERLSDLQRYVSSHMNTDLGQGVYLERSFNRDVEKWQTEQFGDANPNGNIYKKVQEVCAPQFSATTNAYIQCTSNELAKYPSAQDPASDTSKPRQEAYIHNFSSPLWTPDFAGWSILVCIVILVLIAVRLISIGILQLMLKRHYKRI